MTDNESYVDINKEFGRRLRITIRKARRPSEDLEKDDYTNLSDKEWLAQQLSVDEPPDKGVNPSTVYNWLKGKNIPRGYMLVKLANVLDCSLDYLYNTEAFSKSAIAKIPAHYEYSKIAEDIIDTAKDEILIVLRAGNTVLWAEFESIFKEIWDKNNFAVRLVIPEPYLLDKNGKPVRQDNQPIPSRAAEIIAMRRGRYDYIPAQVADDITSTLSMFEEHAKQENPPKKLATMQIPYVPTYIAYISDPGSGKGQALILLINFRTDVREAPIIRIKEEHQKRLFDFFVKDFNRLWAFGELRKHDRNNDTI